ncbi:MAG TPA: hypothetical protein VGV38_11050 [Pyrinomonadaceae bacterium]|nr:hypothetical protein [Pyrinomonadaceae bacterium]
MTPQDHHKTLGIMHLIYGGFQTFMMLLVTVVVFAVFMPVMSSLPNRPEEFPLPLFAAVFAVAMAFNLVLGLLPLVAGYALLKRKSWARMAGIISAVASAMGFPFGTALCVYSLWFFFGEGQAFYKSGEFAGHARGALNDASAAFDDAWYAQARRERGQQQAPYVPPRRPPDWRGE